MSEEAYTAHLQAVCQCKRSLEGLGQQFEELP